MPTHIVHLNFCDSTTIWASHFVFYFFIVVGVVIFKRKLKYTQFALLFFRRLRSQNRTYRSDQMDKCNKICLIPHRFASHRLDSWKAFCIHLECINIYSILWYLILCLVILSLALSIFIPNQMQICTHTHHNFCVFCFVEFDFCFVSNEEFRLHLTPPSPHPYGAGKCIK